MIGDRAVGKSAVSLRRANYRTVGVFALGWLAACAMVYEGKYNWDEGWRFGRVIRLGTGKALVQTPPEECRQEAASADAARTLYAEVAYQSEGRWLRQLVVPIPEGMALKEGQKVYLNLRSCAIAVARASSG
jgi:hypothetical protein